MEYLSNIVRSALETTLPTRIYSLLFDAAWSVVSTFTRAARGIVRLFVVVPIVHAYRHPRVFASLLQELAAIYIMYKVVRMAYDWWNDPLRSTRFTEFCSGQYRLSSWLEKFTTRPNLPTDHLRNTFNDLVMTTVPLPQTHTHPMAAADRSGASSFADRLARQLGLQAYFFQRGRIDERHGRLGSRAHYWAKDLPAQPTRMQLPPNPLIVMVDVDQYVDMPAFLASNVAPTLLYTFQPDSAAKEMANYCYTFDFDQTVDYHVTGGGKFKQLVWNWSMDHILVTRRWYGLPVACAAYLIDRRTTSPDHEVVLLNPMASWGMLTAWIVPWILYGRPLERLQPVTGKFTRLQTITSRGVAISTGRPGDYAVATIPAAVDNTLRIITETSKYPLQMSQVLSFVEGKREAAAALLAYHLSKSSFTPPIVCPLVDSVRNYQFSPGQYEPEAKPTLIPFMNPFVRGAFAPTQTLSNEDQCVRERVLDVRPPLLPMTKFLERTMAEFIAFVVPDEMAGTLDPVDEEVVLDRQARPAQRRLLEVANFLLPRAIVKSFIKKESYPNIKPPRLISTIDSVNKREYSKYLYAMEVVFKKQPWYAFSKTPKLIAERVAKILSTAVSATATDFSRFDGHGSNVMRELEKALLMRMFRIQYHANLLALHHTQFEQKAVATLGTKYDTAFSRASGSPETSLFNSLTNGFIAYLALRMTKVNSVPLTPSEAYARLGIYGGDDGLTADVDPLIYTTAAQRVGQKLTIVVVNRGQPGIAFLARRYSPDVWFGDVNTCCDIVRQLNKIHVTVALPSNVSPAEKLLEKCRALLLSDEETPILGEFAQRVAACHGSPILENDKLTPMQTWLSRYEKKEQYHNHAAYWMDELVQRELPDFRIDMFRAWLRGASSVQYLLAPPVFNPEPEVVTTTPVVVDGQVYPLGTALPPIDQVPYEKKDYRDHKYDHKHEEKADLDDSITMPKPLRWKAKVTPVVTYQPPKTIVVDNIVAPTKPPVVHTISSSVVSKVAPAEAPQPAIVRETFEQTRERKKARGTWVDLPKIPSKFRPVAKEGNSEATPVVARRPPLRRRPNGKTAS